MEGVTLTTYGDAIADVYDEMHAIPADDAVALIAELAGSDGKILELGIGTGRVAIPLAARGLEVVGIDSSEAMLAELRKKSGADRIRTITGDFCETIAGSDFSAAFVAFNTFFALTSQEQQKKCFQNVSKQLRVGGTFALECFYPDIARFAGGQSLRTGGMAVDRVVFEATRHDRNTQTLDSQLVLVKNGSMRLIPIQLRFAYPSEMDLMAELAGMRLKNRYANWAKTAFSNVNMMHVSIYEKL